MHNTEPFDELSSEMKEEIKGRRGELLFAMGIIVKSLADYSAEELWDEIPDDEENVETMERKISLFLQLFEKLKKYGITISDDDAKYLEMYCERETLPFLEVKVRELTDEEIEKLV